MITPYDQTIIPRWRGELYRENPHSKGPRLTALPFPLSKVRLDMSAPGKKRLPELQKYDTWGWQIMMYAISQGAYIS